MLVALRRSCKLRVETNISCCVFCVEDLLRVTGCGVRDVVHAARAGEE